MSKIIHRYKSQSAPGTTHKVVRHEDGTHTCSCKGFIYRQECWHTKGLEVGPRTAQRDTQSPRQAGLIIFGQADPAIRKQVRRYLKRTCAKHRAGAFAYRFEKPSDCDQAIRNVADRFRIRLPRNSRRGFSVTNHT